MSKWNRVVKSIWSIRIVYNISTIDSSWIVSVWERCSISTVIIDARFSTEGHPLMLLALLFGEELPQHTQQAGIIDPAVDVASVINGRWHHVECVSPLEGYLAEQVERSQRGRKSRCLSIEINPITKPPPRWMLFFSHLIKVYRAKQRKWKKKWLPLSVDSAVKWSSRPSAHSRTLLIRILQRIELMEIRWLFFERHGECRLNRMKRSDEWHFGLELHQLSVS